MFFHRCLFGGRDILAPKADIFIYLFSLSLIMVSNRILVVVNISLGLLLTLLLLTFFEVKLPTLGQAQYLLDKEEPLCAVSWKEEFTVWGDLDRCCLEARKQLECRREPQGDFDWACSTGEGMKYWLNSKAYNYCRQQPYW